MKRPSKTTLRNKLDKIVSEIVRKRGNCEKCKSKENLQACHAFSRKFNNTRWDIDAPNVFCLCASCHRKFHDNPIMFTEWVKSYLGSERYDLLKEAHNQIVKYTIDDLLTKLGVLEQIARKKDKPPKGAKNGD